ncbi:hypothetical protein F4054_17510 [Candidatus Poribacteria bacterium]|nr:hypothetical protein [Candidatus Poribacteria bacterium]MYG08459.1 hypothetical protein [Candidatus Poribacteria bacterium]MYK24043.1 hypothetical protein [Candidatus Poribacteria bacterium]
MAIYTWRGEQYFVTKDWLVGDLYIPMNVITEAITHTISDDDFEAHQIEAYIRDAMTLFKPTDTEAAAVPSPEDISLQNTEAGRPLELVIGDQMYSFNVDPYGTLGDLAAWISETLNQAKEQVITAHIVQLEADLENLGFLHNNLTVKIKL